MSASTVLATLKRQIHANKPLRSALAEAARRTACFLPSAGNLGDGLIQLGNFDFLEDIDWKPRIVSTSSPSELVASGILVAGGGGAWKEGLLEYQARNLRPFLEAGGELILLPSSIDGFREFFARYAKQVTLFVREEASLERLKSVAELSGRIHLCHDMAFAVQSERFAPFARSTGTGTLYVHRTDGESISGESRVANVDIPMLWNGVEWGSLQACLQPIVAAAHLISQFSVIDTDRLHMAVLAAMLNRNVVMRANAYFKNRAVYEYSLAGANNVKFSKGLEKNAEIKKVKNNHERVDGQNDIFSTENTHVNDEIVALARLRREYFEPEIVRLQKEVARLETAKTEWFEPELERYGAENDKLKAELIASEQVRSKLEDASAVYEKTRTEWYEPELQRLRAKNEELEANLAYARERVQALERRDAELEESVGRLSSENQQLRQTHEDAASGWQSDIEIRKKEFIAILAERDDARNELEAVKSELADQLRLRSEVYGPEVQRLQAHRQRLQDELASLALEKAIAVEGVKSELRLFQSKVKNTPDQKEHQLLRRRVLFHAEQRARSAATVARLEFRLAEVEQLCENWYVPELARLTGVIQDQDKVRLEWFEPQLSRLETRIQELESTLRQFDDLRATWFEPQLAQRAERIAELEQMMGTRSLVRRVLGRLKRVIVGQRRFLRYPQ